MRVSALEHALIVKETVGCWRSAGEVNGMVVSQFFREGSFKFYLVRRSQTVLRKLEFLSLGCGRAS